MSSGLEAAWQRYEAAKKSSDAAADEWRRLLTFAAFQAEGDAIQELRVAERDLFAALAAHFNGDANGDA